MRIVRSSLGGGQMLADQLAGKQATNAPGFLTIALFLGAYLVLLIPGNYLILKKLDKREFAWFTAPLLILGFTVGSYVMALSIKGGLLTVNRAVVLETAANTDQVAGYGQMTVYSPRRSSYDIALGNPSDANSPYRDVVPSEIFNTNMQSLTGELTIDHDNTTVLRGTEVRLWDKRSFDTPVMTNLGGAIEARAQMLDEKRAQVTVTNKTRYTLHDCALINTGAEPAQIGDLAPGASMQKTLRWMAKDNTTSLHIPFTSSPPVNDMPGENQKPDTPDLVHSRVRYAMTQALAQGQGQSYDYYGNEQMDNFGRVTNAFVGWFYDPLLEVEIDGKKTAGEEVNMLFVHLPPPDNAPPAFRQAMNPFEQPPLLKVEGEQPIGPRRPGGIFK